MVLDVGRKGQEWGERGGGEGVVPGMLFSCCELYNLIRQYLYWGGDLDASI